MRALRIETLSWMLEGRNYYLNWIDIYRMGHVA